MTEIGKGYVGILFDKAQIGKDMAESMAAAGPEASKAGGMLGSLFSGSWQTKMVELSVAVGVGLFAIGEKFESAYHTIEQRTGATGDALKGLEGDFKNVFASAPGANFHNVADAISELYVRTGLAGPALDEFARKQVELGKITKTDVGANIDTTTSLFKQFGIAAADQSGKLDVLFKAAQVSGKSVADIGDSMKAVAPMSQVLGLSFEKTVALTANLSALGLPASKVMMGLGTEFAKAAKAGEDPLAVIGKLIATIKQAPDSTTAATLATKEFGIGARQAATLVDALRSGALDLGDTFGKITSGEGGIDDTAKSTMSLGDKFSLLKNKALVALEPIAMKVVDLANAMIDQVEPAVGFLVDIFERLGAIVSPIFQNVARNVGDFFSTLTTGFTNDEGTPFENFALRIRSAIGAVADEISRLVGFYGPRLRDIWAEVVAVWNRDLYPALRDKVLPILKDIGAWIQDHMRPILIGLGIELGLLVAPTLTVAAGLIYAYAHFKTFRDTVDGVVHWMHDNIPPAFDAVRAAAIAAFTWIDENVVPIVQKFVAFMSEQIEHLSAWWSEHWDSIHDAVRNTLEAIGAFIYVQVQAVLFIWNHFGDQIIATITLAWDTVQNIVQNAVRIISDVIALFADLMSGNWGKAWNDVKDILAAVVDGIESSIGAFGQFVWDFFSSLPGNILASIGDLGPKLYDVGVAALTGMLDGIKSVWNSILDWFKGLPGLIVSAIGDLSSTLLHAGADLASGFIQGIANAFGVGSDTGVASGLEASFKAAHPELFTSGSPASTPGNLSTSRPGLALGGWVDAAYGQPVDKTVHGGEYMLSTDMLAGRQRIDPSVIDALSRSGGSSQPVGAVHIDTVNVNGENAPSALEQLPAVLRQGITQAQMVSA